MKKLLNGRAYIVAALVALVTVVVYLPALQNEFVNWDDPMYIYDNTHIRSLDPGFFRWAFFESQRILWHPLTWISHAVDYAIWGLNPVGHHLTSIILHGMNTFLVVILIVRLLDAANLPSPLNALIVAAITGLLFGLHPLHVESVAWVTERKDLLSAFFFLLSLMSYVSYKSYKTYRTYLLSLLFFILSLMSKPMAVTLPLVMLIMDWYPMGRCGGKTRLKKAIMEKIPFFAFSLLSAFVTIMPGHFAAVSRVMKASLPEGILLGCRTLIFYLSKMLWPTHLAHFYPYYRDVSFFSSRYLVPLLLVIAITISCGILWKRQRIWLAVWSYYIVTLLPVLGIVPFGAQAMADRYTYLPSIGPFLLISCGAASVIEKITIPGKRNVVVKVFSFSMLAILMGLMTDMTIKQIGVWKNSITLWSHLIEVRKPDIAPVAYNYRGMAYDEKGQYDKALEDFGTMLSLFPNAETYHYRGVTYVEMGRYEEALKDFTNAINLSPVPEFTYHHNRAIVYEKLGKYEEALKDYSRAISLNPDSAGSYYNRALLYGKLGRQEEALKDFREAESIKQREKKP